MRGHSTLKRQDFRNVWFRCVRTSSLQESMLSWTSPRATLPRTLMSLSWNGSETAIPSSWWGVHHMWNEPKTPTPSLPVRWLRSGGRGKAAVAATVSFPSGSQESPYPARSPKGIQTSLQHLQTFQHLLGVPHARLAFEE